jgi:indolepyruvate ferredoxin oxidoreductase
MLKERGIEGRMANNEALSVAALNGSQMAPLRAMTVFKSVGLHVASDALALANLAGPHPEGGAVVVVGDDPWSESTQVPADSRYLLRHLFVPVLEPSTIQEIKDFVPASFAISKASGLYAGYLLTTTLADGGGTVECRPNRYPLTNTNFPFDLDTLSLDLENTVLLPPRTGRREIDMADRHVRLWEKANELNLNRLEDVQGQDEILIVTSGMAYQYVRQSLQDLKLDEQIPVLKLGVTYPLDPGAFEPLLQRFKHVVVIEERRAFVEEQIAAIAIQLHQRTGQRQAQLWGKHFPADLKGVPGYLGLNTSIVTERLIRFLRHIESPLAKKSSDAAERELSLIPKRSEKGSPIPLRTPTFCPGCPHRDSSSLLLQIKKQFTDPRYMRRRHRREPVDLVFHGDTGCYTMLMFEPTAPLMHNYSGMGLGGGTGSGIDPFVKNKQVVFMGDSTFFHSGSTAISNSITGRQDITYIILANDTTAMTGHQPLPSVDKDLLKRPIQAQDIESVVRAITRGKSPISRVDPGDRGNYKRVLEETILADGVKIIIADKECGITYNRRKRRQERAEQKDQGYVRKKVHMNITPEVCEFCRECTLATACPGLTIEPSPYGLKMSTDLSWCVNDGACAKIGACPSFEEVIVTRRNRPTPRGHKMTLAGIPEPSRRFTGDTWRCWMAGVGGMGIGTAAAVLVNAANQEGYRVQFSDKKGLAIRNGGVYSQLIVSKKEMPASMTLGYGKADLLLGMDMMEAARAVDANMPFYVASPDRTAVVVNIDSAPTVRMLLGEDEFDPAILESTLRNACKRDEFFAARLASLCERVFGTKLYANLTMLGVAYQLGHLPFTRDAIQKAIRQTMRVDVDKNLRAFDVGRKLVSHPELFNEIFGDQHEERSLARIVREQVAYLNIQRVGARKALKADGNLPGSKRRLPDTPIARAYKHLTFTTLRACRELDRKTMGDIAIRVYELIQWGGINYAKRYASQIRRVFLADRESGDFAATRAAVWNLAKLMLIKDEFYVAAMLTSHSKIRRDRQRYNVNPANGDKLRYRRTFHPRIFGMQVDIPLPHWALHVVKRGRWLRHVLPGYRKHERDFLSWYEGVIETFCNAEEADYQKLVEVLRLPEDVTGYAEIRLPKMKACRERGDQILQTLGRGPKEAATVSTSR